MAELLWCSRTTPGGNQLLGQLSQGHAGRQAVGYGLAGRTGARSRMDNGSVIGARSFCSLLEGTTCSQMSPQWSVRSGRASNWRTASSAVPKVATERGLHLRQCALRPAWRYRPHRPTPLWRPPADRFRPGHIFVGVAEVPKVVHVVGQLQVGLHVGARRATALVAIVVRTTACSV